MADAAPNDSPSQGAAAPPAPPPAESQTPAEPVDPRKRLAAWYLLCGHRALWRLPLIPAVALLVGFLMLRGTFSDPQANLAESRRLIDEIKPAPVPDAENAALVYRKAFAARVPYPGKSLDPEKIAGRNRSIFGRPDMQAYFQANVTAMQLFMSASKMEKCNWNLDYDHLFAARVLHLKEMRSAARMLAAHARWLAHQGDHMGAASAVAGMYRMARHVSGDRTLLSGLVEIAITAIGDQALQDIVLWDTPMTSAEVEAYRNALSTQRDPDARCLYFLEGERAAALQLLDNKDLEEGPEQVPGERFHFAFLNPAADRDCIKNATLEWLDLLKKDALPKDQYELERKFSEVLRKHQTGPAVLANFVGAPIARSLVAYRRWADSGRTVEAGFAFLGYRVKHGKDPESLKSLVPEFLKEMPTGASDRQPLRMRIDEDGLRFDDEDADALSRNADKRMKIDPPAVLEPSPEPNEDGFFHPGAIRIYVLGENGKDDGGFSGWTWSREKVPEQYYDGRTPDDGSFVLPPAQPKASGESKIIKEPDSE